jgi:hypothetical protein
MRFPHEIMYVATQFLHAEFTVILMSMQCASTMESDAESLNEAGLQIAVGQQNKGGYAGNGTGA